ncbi:MAG: class I SAM-dependent methyltransferase [Rhodobacteraceae bacterium]|nr:MAG: class I SAM-dependent methyltransferase [Paracoccaceae bacterium]
MRHGMERKREPSAPDAPGFFIPCRHAGDTPRPPDAPGYAAVEALFRATEPSFAPILDRLAPGAPLPPADPPPRWGQDWFPSADAAALLAVLADRPPARIVEVGAGHSTRFFAAAAPQAEMRAIDPAPRARLPERVALRAEPLSPAHAPLFEALAPGDVASFDGSHILFPHTDVDLMLTAILPVLKPGVLVHIHDVFLPDPYPPEWTWRGYGEQIGVAAWLLAGGLRPVFPVRYALTRMAGAARLPADPLASSLWAVKTAPLAHAPAGS